MHCTAVDCEWGEWGDWPECPDACGIQQIMRYRTMNEHRHGGLACEGSGQESKTCNAWLETKNDLLTCEAENEEKSKANAIDMETLQQTLKRREEQIINLEVLLRLKLTMLFNIITILYIYRMK